MIDFNAGEDYFSSETWVVILGGAAVRRCDFRPDPASGVWRGSFFPA